MNPRILIVRVGAMGDVLHALPAVAALRAAMPSAWIGWAIHPRWAPLLRSASGGQPIVDSLHLVDPRAWTLSNRFSDLFSLRRELRAGNYDLAVDLQGSIRSAVIARMTGRQQISGSATPRETPARIFYTQRVRITQPHVIDQAAEILSAALNTPLRPRVPSLPYDPEAEAWASPYSHKPFVMISPSAGWGAKEWMPDKYVTLIQRLPIGYRVLLNASPAGPATFAHQIAAASGTEAVHSTVAQLIALTRRAALVIGGDTGPVHLAAALRRPTLALFGPTDPARNGPAFPGARSLSLRHRSSTTDHHRTPVPDAGLKQITVEEVLEAAQSLLEPQPGA